MSEGNPITIRPARMDEAEAIVALIHRAFAQYRGRLQPESSALSEDADKIGALMAQGVVLLAEEGEQITGCVAIQRKPDCIYAGRLAVDPAARGNGTGRALMAAAEDVARSLGRGPLRVDVRLALTENRAFFRSLGFVEGTHHRHPGFAEPTYVELEKILS